MTANRRVIIVVGQAGLAVARCLQRRGVDPVVFDANAMVGDAWRRRYDSLVLFTPAQYDGLPDVPFPAPRDTHPTKDQVADHLAAYATRFSIEIRSGYRVERLSRQGANGPFRIDTDHQGVEATVVVVATGALQDPAAPPFAGRLSEAVTQMHGSGCRTPSDMRGRRVLVVGAGNSGGQIAGEPSGHVDTAISYDRLPKRLPQRLLGQDIFWWLQKMGVLDRPRAASGGSAGAVGAIPLIGSPLGDLGRSGALRHVARVVDAGTEGPLLADGTTERPDGVIWATGSRNDFSWIDIPDPLLPDGTPAHHRGVRTTVPGLSFIGMPGLQTKGSAFLGFVGRDAEHLAGELLEARAV